MSAKNKNIWCANCPAFWPMDKVGWFFWISPGNGQCPQPSGDILGAVIEDPWGAPLILGKSRHYHLGFGFQIGWESSFHKQRKKCRKPFSLRPKVYLELYLGAFSSLFSMIVVFRSRLGEVQKEMGRQSHWEGRFYCESKSSSGRVTWDQRKCAVSQLYGFGCVA